jgi:hypothetical protein
MRYRVLLGALAGLAIVALGATVAVAAPPGDGFTRHTAIEVTLPSTTGPIDSTNAPHSISRRIGGQSCSSAGTDGHVVWFKWEATLSTGPINVDTLGSTYDTVLYVFQQGKLIECNDDAFQGTVHSFVDFFSVAGKTYYFAVAAFDGDAGGDAELTIILE